jgi:hypothetical protein
MSHLISANSYIKTMGLKKKYRTTMGLKLVEVEQWTMMGIRALKQ